MAAMSFADDLADVRRRLAALETEAAELRRRDAMQRTSPTDTELAAAIGTAARQITEAARKLNSDS
jgi:hypothetical protein